MNLQVKGNSNYVGTICKIDNIIKLSGCDNIVGTSLFGNHVIVSKNVQIGEVGVFFPVETKLHSAFLSVNNLYRDKTLNTNQEKAGFFEIKGRIRCMKLRGYKSEGFWLPLESIYNVISLNEDLSKYLNEDFDHIDGIKFCEKYIVIQKNQGSENKNEKQNKKNRFSKVIDTQFRFHIDTAQLGKNLHKLNLDDYIQISDKWHGTSAIVSYVLCNKKLSLIKKIFKKLGINIIDKEYDYLYSSRKVIKNKFADQSYILKDTKSFEKKFKELKMASKKRKVRDFYKVTHNIEIDEKLYRIIFPLKKALVSKFNLTYFESFNELKGFSSYIEEEFNITSLKGFYSENIWKIGMDELKSFLSKGMTIYYEIVGFTSNGAYIQKDYDYGCKVGEHTIIIYRITYTNEDGKVFEYSTKQVQDWCKINGLNPVVQLYYGTIKNYLSKNSLEAIEKDHWHLSLFKTMSTAYLEGECSFCNKKVPREGVVLRVEKNDIEVYKLKAFAFQERETKLLDKGEIDIEEIGEEKDSTDDIEVSILKEEKK